MASIYKIQYDGEGRVLKNTLGPGWRDGPAGKNTCCTYKEDMSLVPSTHTGTLVPGYSMLSAGLSR